VGQPQKWYRHYGKDKNPCPCQELKPSCPDCSQPVTLPPDLSQLGDTFKTCHNTVFLMQYYKNSGIMPPTGKQPESLFQFL